MRFTAKLSLFVLLLCVPAGASTILVGSDGAGAVQLINSDGTPAGTFGSSAGTAAASDGFGGLFVALPGDSSSTVDVYGATQNLLSSFDFTAPADSRPFAAYITDMSWGTGGTLWVSTYSGEVYHLDSSGTILGQFDTGTAAPGVAFNGTDLYTTSGPGFTSPSPLVYERTPSGTVITTVDTGLNDTLGIGYDGSNSTLWIGGFDVLSEVSLQGALLDTLSIDGTHYGIDVQTVAPAAVPEPSSRALVLVGLAALLIWRSRHKLLWPCALILCGALAPASQAAVSVTSLAPSPAGPQPVGTSISFTATASDTQAGALRYRFQVRPAGGSTWFLIRDFSPATSVVWTPSDSEGSYEIEVTALNRMTHNEASLSTLYTVSSRVTGSGPVVNSTQHPLVALYSAPSCPSGSQMRVRFKLPTDSYWQSTQLKACDGTHSMNFYIAGMRASSQYQLRQDVISGPHVSTGSTLLFTTGAIAASLPSTSAIKPLETPSSMEEGVELFSPLLGTRPFALDAGLNVIWYAPTTQVYMTRPVPGGGYLVMYGYTTDLANSGLRQYDLAGNLVKETNVERMNDELSALGMSPVTAFHHEIRKLANGDYMLLAMTELVSSAQGSSADIAGDMILVLDQNLQLLWAWDSFQHLDVTRKAVLGEVCINIGAGGCVLLLASQANDWLHGNSVALAPDGNIIYSARHQDFVYKIAYENGSGDGHVIWRLGKGGDFTWLSSDPYPWFSHQHDVEYESATTLSVFDDGNTRVAFNGPGDSRGQGLNLDEVNKTVTFVLNADLGSYSSALGSAQRLYNGNYAFLSGLISGNLTQFSEWNTSGAPVANIQVNAQDYRGFRLRDLYSAPY